MAAIEFPFFISYFKQNESYPPNHFQSSGTRSKNIISFPKLTKKFTLRKRFSQYFLPIFKTPYNIFGSTIFFPLGASMSLILRCSFTGEEEEEGGNFVNIETHYLASTIAGVEENRSVADI